MRFIDSLDKDRPDRAVLIHLFSFFILIGLKVCVADEIKAVVGYKLRKIGLLVQTRVLDLSLLGPARNIRIVLAGGGHIRQRHGHLLIAAVIGHEILAGSGQPHDNVVAVL